MMILDKPEILARLFYPRREWLARNEVSSATRVAVPVEQNIRIGGYIHGDAPDGADIVFFHGNGEIAAEYHDIAPLFVTRGINFHIFDYRGYGQSDGQPTVSYMLKDAHQILSWVLDRRADHHHTGPLIVMGRSLGSAPALELVECYPDSIHGLIVESGFARTDHLLVLFGFHPRELGFTEEQGFRNLDKIRSFHRPTLIIHGQYDRLIPPREGKLLYEASPAREKKFALIPGADHNTIFAVGMEYYLESIDWLVDRARRCVV